MIELVGLKNCDSCRNARKWLDAEDIVYQFRDIRDAPPSTDELQHWLSRVGPDQLINRRSTTWRQLSEVDRAQAAQPHAAELLHANPTLIKRPVIINGSSVTVGFIADVKQACRD